MDLVEKYIGEKKLDIFVKVIDRKTGKTISSIDTKKFMKMVDNFTRRPKNIQDAIDLYNKAVPEHKATVEYEFD